MSKRRLSRAKWLLLAPLLLAIFPILDLVMDAANAQATTLRVTRRTDSDDGVCNSHCSIREALAVATPGTTIVVPFGVYTVESALEIPTGASVTLEGDGRDRTFIEAANTSRWPNRPVIDVRGATVHIENLTIQEGNTGIANSGRLSLTNVRVRNNVRRVLEGGGIANLQGGQANANQLFSYRKRGRGRRWHPQSGYLHHDDRQHD